MNKQSHYSNKLLSHRLRSFSEIEHTPSALKAACLSGIHYLEIDCRVSKDGNIFIYHNPNSGNDINGKFSFSKTKSSVIEKSCFANGEKILTLDKALEIFADLRSDDQILCIDIKDYGFEKRYLKEVRYYGLENNVSFISWIPQTLIQLHKIGSKAPLIFSHWNIIIFKKVGKLISEIIKNKIFRFSYYVILGNQTFMKPLKFYSHGYQYGYICQEIPDKIAHILLNTRGGVCIPLSMINNQVIEYFTKKKLRLWVFNTKGTEQFLKYASVKDIEVVFCDNAAKVYSDIT